MLQWVALILHARRLRCAYNEAGDLNRSIANSLAWIYVHLYSTSCTEELLHQLRVLMFTFLIYLI